jgi:hypothetical protein
MASAQKPDPRVWLQAASIARRRLPEAWSRGHVAAQGNTSQAQPAAWSCAGRSPCCYIALALGHAERTTARP